MDDISITTNNPYVGPRTFEEADKDRFFGRVREARELLALVIGERLTLFYAQSGAGKSSLINTRLIPALRDEGFDVLSVGRVSGELPAGLAAVQNLFVFNLIARLNEALPSEEHQSAATLAGMTLTAFLGGDDNADAATTVETAPTVLIIDQFEEILTSHLDRWPQRADFFQQLRAAQEQFPNLWVVLVMREDYVAGLVPYIPLLPDRLHARFYMQRMTYGAALEAMTRPAAEIGQRPFAPGVAEELVDNLRLVQNVWSSAEGIELVKGEFIEPVQLQVVCFQLWENLEKSGRQGDKETGKQREHDEHSAISYAYITRSDLTALAGEQALAHFVNQALAAYYEQALQKVLVAPQVQTPERNVSERELRDWFSTKLITSEETRGLVHQGIEAEGAGDLPTAAVKLLESQFLLRAESHAGSLWYELVHDRFVQPILQANRDWLLAQSNPVIVAARLWLENNHDPVRLLRGAQLADAQRYATDHLRDLGDMEHKFLEASARQQAAEEEATRRRELAAAQASATQWRRLVLGIAALTLVALIATGVAIISANTAANQSRIASALLVANNSLLLTNSKTDTSLLLAVEAYRLHDSSETRSQLLYATERSYAPEIAILNAHTDRVWGATFSSNGKIIATASADGTIQLWDAATRRPVRRLESSKPGLGLYRVAISPNNRLIAAGADHGYVFIWDLQTGKLLKTFRPHSDNVLNLAFSPNGTKLATGGADNRVVVSDVETWQPIFISSHDNWVWDVAFSPDETTLASVGRDKTVRLWDLTDTAGLTYTVAMTDHEAVVTSLAFYPSPTTTILASGDADGGVIFWDLTLWQKNHQKPTHSQVWKPIHITWWAMDFSPNGKMLALANSSGSLQYWTVDFSHGVESDAILKKLSLGLNGHTDAAVDVKFSPDNATAVVASWDGKASLWAVNSGTALIGQGEPVQSIATSKDDKTLYASGTNSVVAWDVASRRPRWQKKIQPPPNVNLTMLSPGGLRLATTNGSGNIYLWDIETGQSPGITLTAHLTKVTTLSFSPDGNLLASGDLSGNIKLWNVERRQQIGSKSFAHQKGLQTLVFNQNSKLLASGGCGDETANSSSSECSNGEIQFWDIATGKLVGQPIKTGASYVNVLTFSHDNRMIASGSKSQVVVWNISTHQALFSHKEHAKGVLSLAFSPNDSFLASGGPFGTLDDHIGTIILWDVNRRVRFGRSFNEHDSAVTSLLFSRDGSMLYSASKDQSIVINDLRVETWLKRACQVANRNLTQEEWRLYVGVLPYQKTCPEFP